MTKNKTYTFIDLFAGCGGLSEGFMESGHFKGLAHIEWEYPMVQTLRKRLVKKWNETSEQAQKRVICFDIQRTDELLYGNWTQESIDLYAKNNSEEIQKGLKNMLKGENVDLIIGGPPCQAYSIHGRATDKNSMQDDYRNYLFESFVKVVDEIKPKAFIFENVTGMLSAKPGGTPVVERIYKAVTDIGYSILSPNLFKEAVYNAYDYSVPQNRKRVILCGFKNDSDFSLEEFYNYLSKNKCSKHVTVRDAIGSLPPIYPMEKIEKVKGKNLSHYATDCSDQFHMPRHCSSRDINAFREWISHDMNKCSQKEAIEFYKKVTGKTTLYRKYRNLEWDKPSPTVVAHLQKDGFMFIHPDIEQVRFITIREAALLMSFPKDYDFIGSRAYCFKMIGNAVPVNFAKAIAESMYKTIRQ
ncbi:MAG: DNA cytosine methyltransferase [Bacteroidales bacterium]|jgi:DNA (cytosine-5)-methyltransferase 1|nr:DNA cytosine methyltransferase [Bacteroidales bacterium]